MINLKKYIDLKLIFAIFLLQLSLNSFDVFQRFYFTYKNGKETISRFEGIEIFSKLSEFIGVVIYMSIASILVNYTIQKKKSWKLSTLLHILIALTLPVFTWMIYFIITEWKFNSLKLTEFFIDRYIRVVDYYLILYFLLLGLIYVYFYVKRIQISKIQNAKLKEQLSNTRLKFLQSQMHPHFLFNTLNSIHSLMDSDLKKSKEMIVDLSDVLREVLEHKDQNLIELQDELHLLYKYINIKKTRFSDHLNFYLNIKDGLENVLVPNMFLQPIVENAIKHGYSKNVLQLDVFLFIYKKENNLVVKVENNGEKIKENTATLLKKGTGLSNINDRLQTLFETDYEFKIYNKSNRVITKVCFPIKMSISKIST
nr:histidine kinase [uncultured Psychroserpens sp.]